MSNQSDCPFCDSGDRIVSQNEHAIILLSNPRKVPGHVLVVPKRHVEQPWDLTAEELQAIFALTFEAEKKLIAAGFGDGCDIRQNYRPFMQQSRLKVNHVHFHVLPRTLEDYIYTVSERYDTQLFADLDDTERQAVTKVLQ